MRNYAVWFHVGLRTSLFYSYYDFVSFFFIRVKKDSIPLSFLTFSHDNYFFSEDDHKLM